MSSEVLSETGFETAPAGSGRGVDRPPVSRTETPIIRYRDMVFGDFGHWCRSSELVVQQQDDSQRHDEQQIDRMPGTHGCLLPPAMVDEQRGEDVQCREH
jgi:hypothetical protein